SRRRAGVARGHAAGDWDGVDEPAASGAGAEPRSSDTADEWAQDFFDPDPWGDSAPAAPVRSTPPPRRPAAGSGAAGARASGRKSRLPKMAEWRNGTGPR
ncbi:MAG: hypothetical protein P4L20_19465, partial [Acidimicrobiales bacterium]|nr:hypothetical protein [Acidimicrobiales bacterium]